MPPLQFPRSDGDRSRWLSKTEPGINGWYERCPPSHPKYKLYEEKVGEHLAKVLNKPTSSPITMPDGYALFMHHQPRSDGSVRQDAYLMGSKSVLRFRSTKEFFEHAEWLMDTTKDINDHSKCGCKYNSVSSISIDKKQASVPGSPLAKKTNNQAGPSQPKKQRLEPVLSEECSDGVVVERSIDLRTCRRYRKGELVFFRINTINPPAGSNVPPLTHWPGLIAEIENKEEIKTKPARDGNMASSSSSAAWSLFGGVPPADMQISSTIIKTTIHHIRPLGQFSSSDASSVKHEAHHMLPYAAGIELFGGSTGWLEIGIEGDKILSEAIRKEAEAQRQQGKKRKEGEEEVKPLTKEDSEIGKALDERWKKGWGRKIVYHDMPSDWSTTVFRLAMALKTARKIANMWTQTDNVTILPETIGLTKEDIDDLASNRKTLYQGLWWQGERIWMEDMVRLRLSWDKLPSELRTYSRPEGCIFARIRLISVEVVDKGDTTSAHHKYRSLIYGDLFELVPAYSNSNSNTNNNDDKVIDLTNDTDSLSYPLPPPGAKPSEVPVPTTYKAPKGWKYRQINEEGFEVQVDVLDIAGRVYPDLLETKHAWFKLDPKAVPGLTSGGGAGMEVDATATATTSADADMNGGGGSGGGRRKGKDEQGKIVAGKAVMSLIGLVSASDIPSRGSDTWSEDLYKIVSTATTETDREMKEYYAKRLCKELGFPEPNFTSASSTSSSKKPLVTTNMTATPISATEPATTIDGSQMKQASVPSPSVSVINQAALLTSNHSTVMQPHLSVTATPTN